MRFAVTLVVLAACGSAAELPLDAASIDGTAPLADAASPPADAAPPPDAISCTSVVVEGSVTIDSADDLAPLLPVAKVTGELLIVAPDVTSLDLPCLTEVGRVTVQWPTSLEELSLDALATAPHVSITGQPELTALRLPAVAGYLDLIVRNDEALTTIEAPLAARSNGGVELRDLPELATVSLPALTYARELQVVGTHLTALSLPALAEPDRGLTITDNPVLASLDLPAVVDIWDHFVLERDPALTSITFGTEEVNTFPAFAVRIVDVDALTSLAFLAHHNVHGLTIEGNAGLTELGIAPSSVSGAAAVVDNPQLSSCAVELLRPNVFELVNEGNLEDGPCP